jgi:protein-glutamine gamma-glutamyltransferase
MTTGVSTERPESAESGGETGTLLLTVLAAATLTAARSASNSYPWLLLAQSLLAVAGPLAIVLTQRRFPATRRWWDRWLPAVLAVWCLWPLASESVLRLFSIGEAHELVMLVCLQNAALVLSVYSHRRRCQQTACLLGGFLVLFAIVIESGTAVGVLAALYGVWLLWWLMARYWERIQHARSAVQVTRCLPVRWSVMGVTVLSGVLAAAVFGASGGATYVLRGIMPASGGDRWNDPFARAGVRDGDAVVAAQDDAMSFGPVESQLFLESCMPTLYDMFNDLYGEPLKSRQKQERAVSLAQEKIRQMEQRVAQTQRSGREFSVLRRRTEAKQQALDDRQAPAMLYVVGQVPVHLALEAFDTFDGIAWSYSGHSAEPEASVPASSPPILRQVEGERSWFCFQPSSLWPIARGTLQHGVKVINLKTNRVPAPPQLTAVHIDRLDQPDFWGWTEDGMAAMVAREHIPQLTVLHLRSRQVDLQVLREHDFTSRTGSPRGNPAATAEPTPDFEVARSRIRENSGVLREGQRPPQPPNSHEFGYSPSQCATSKTPDANDGGVATLARAWTGGVPRGWQQVEAVVRRLREDFRLDPDADVSPESGDVVGYFLRERCGPDYCFATTAAVMLRHLGYRTRLVAGFYARRERFDRVAGQTTVLPQDAHVWVEVQIDGHTWLTIEPTPGYEPPREVRTWQRWAATTIRSALDWSARHPLRLAFCIVLIITGWRTRLRWLDAVAGAVWRVAGLGRPERRLRATIRLLEWRCRLAGRARPDNVTLSHWYGELAASLPAETAAAVTRFLRQAERALYRPRTGCEKMGLAPSGNGENAGKPAVAKVPVPILSQPRTGRAVAGDPGTLLQACRTVVQELTLRVLRQTDGGNEMVDLMQRKRRWLC